MTVGRRLFLGAFTAGAVTFATGPEAAAADDGSENAELRARIEAAGKNDA